jgi:hypothetical protein
MVSTVAAWVVLYFFEENLDIERIFPEDFDNHELKN